MNSTDRCRRVYGSEAMNIMERAFDQAFEGLSQESKRQPNVRRDLALCIIRLFDEGESRPLRLSRMALATATIVTASDESVSSMEASLVETLLASRSPRALMGGL
jgi:cytochrome P450